jgi:hypothetical protein
MKVKSGFSDDPDLYLSEVEVAGGTLAKAHARSVDPVLIAGDLDSGEKFVDAITALAFRHAEQAERDHARLLGAIDSGTVRAERGV